MRVIAKAMGFYAGIRRREGQVFEVPEGATGSWFESVASHQPAKAPKSRKESPPDTFSAMNAAAGGMPPV